MIKYVVLGVTNGEGHSDPTVIVGTNQPKMFAEFSKLCNELDSDDDIVHEYTNYKKNCTSNIYSDGCDDFGVHLLELEDHKAYLIEIECNYVNQFKIINGELSELKQMIDEHIHNPDAPIIHELITPSSLKFKLHSNYSFMQIEEFVNENEMELREIGPDVIGESIVIVKPDKMSTVTFIMTGYNSNGAVYECVYCDYQQN